MDLLNSVCARNNNEVGTLFFPYKEPPGYWAVLESGLRKEFPDGVISFANTFTDLPVFRAADLFAFPALGRYLRSFEDYPEAECTRLSYRMFSHEFEFDGMALSEHGFCEEFSRFHQDATERFRAMAHAERALRWSQIRALATQREAIRVESANDEWVCINGLKYHFSSSAHGLGGFNPGRFPELFLGDTPGWDSRYSVADFIPGTDLLDLRNRVGWKAKGRINWVSLEQLAKADKNVLGRARTRLRKCEQSSMGAGVHAAEESHALF